MRRLVPVALAALLAVGTLSVPAASAAPAPNIVEAKKKDPGSLSIRLLDAAVSRRNDPRSRLYINDHVSQGTTVIRHVEVANTTKRALKLQFYADAATVEKGQFTPAPGRGANELTSWTTVTPSSGTLQPGGRTTLTVRIAVPDDADDGERYAVVLAELPAPDSDGKTIGVGARVGVRIYLSVGNGTEPRTDFVVNSLTAARTDDGLPIVSAEVHNTGRRAVDLSGTLTLDEGPGGLRAGPYPVTLGTTLGIGQTAPVTVQLDEQLPAGPWHAVLELSSGTVTRAVEGTITFPEGAGSVGPVVPVEPLHQRRDVVAPIAAGLLGLLAFLLFLFFWRRRKRDDDEDKNDAGRAPTNRPVVAGAAR